MSLCPDDFKDDVSHWDDTHHQSLNMLKLFIFNASSIGLNRFSLHLCIRENIAEENHRHLGKATQKTLFHWEFTPVVVVKEFFCENFHVLSENGFGTQLYCLSNLFPTRGRLRNKKHFRKRRGGQGWIFRRRFFF